MDLEILSNYGSRFMDGTLITVKLVSPASLAGIVLAVVTALARVSKRRWMSLPAYCYIYFFRGTPLLIQLFIENECQGNKADGRKKS